MVIIIGLSAMNGFEKEGEKSRPVSVIPHAQLEGVDEPLKDWREIQDIANENPNVVDAAPYVLFTALFEKADQLTPVQVRGVDPRQEMSIVIFIAMLILWIVLSSR